MTTVSTKHVPTAAGEPALSVRAAKGSLIDDMEIIRKYCMPEQGPRKGPNASSISFGACKDVPTSTNRADLNPKSMADVEPSATRHARSRYMNSKHFEMGFDGGPAVAESRAAYAAPPRDRLVNRQVHAIGSASAQNKSNLFQGNKGEWVDDIESTHRIDFRPKHLPQDPANKEQVKRHRENHFDFGTDPADFKTTHAEVFPAVMVEPPKPIQAPPSAVALGHADYPWAENLSSTARADFAKPQMPDDDSLTAFVKQGPPLTFGDDTREYRTEYRGAYKKTGLLDCSTLTDEQLRMLGVTREQIIPRKVELPFLQGEAFKNSLGQSIATK